MTRYEWQCPVCKHKVLGTAKPPKPGVFIFKALLCKSCRHPMIPTGNTVVWSRSRPKP